MKRFTSFARQLGRACAALVTVALVSSPVIAAEFPEKGSSITLIVPFGPGGQIDVMGRMMASYWDEQWGTRTVVLNKPGASTQLALSELLKQKPDGHTIVFTQGFDTQMTYLNTQSNAPFSRSSFIPVGLVQDTPAGWVVNSDSPYQTMTQLLEASKANPGTISFGSPTTRSSAMLVLNDFREKYGAKIENVPFNDAPSMINALIGGHIDLAVSNPAVILPHIKAGRLRALMVTGSKPSAHFPQVPTAADLEISSLNLGGNTGMALVKGTPPAIVQEWSAMLKKITGDANVRKKMSDMGINLEYLSPEEYAELWTATEGEVAKFLLEVDGQVRPVE